MQIDFVPPQCSALGDFLLNAAPDSLENLVLNSIWQDDAADMSFYISYFESIFKSTVLDVYMRFFDFDQDSFERTVKAWANSDRVVFRGCIIDIDTDLNFTGPEYKTKYLSFDSTGCNFGNDWKYCREKYQRIFKAISESSLKDSLKFINLYACDFDEEYVEELMDKYNLRHISVIEKLDEPYEYY